MQKMKQTSQAKKVTSMSSSDVQLTTQLMLVSITLLILTAPQYVRYVVYVSRDAYASIDELSFYYLIMNITNKMLTLNSAVNFFLYCLGGSKFRKEAISILVCRRRNSIDPLSMSKGQRS